MTEKTMTADSKSEIFKEINSDADRSINYVLIAYYFLGIALSMLYQTYLIGFGLGTFCLIVYFGVKMILPKSNLYQYVLSLVLAVFTAQFIYQSHGLFEMHFFVFVGSAILMIYQNWRLQIPLILFSILHHGLFVFFQNAGNTEIYFTQLAHMDLVTFIIHEVLTATIVGLCGWWSFVSEKRTIHDHYSTLALEKQLTSVSKNITFAEEISKGNLGFVSSNDEESDEMKNGLIKMQKNLASSAKREAEEKFITIGINKISEILRGNSKDVKTLSDELIKGIVKYTNLNQGGIFLLEGEDADQYLNLTACYAYERKKFLQKRIEIGQGLIGQCYLERDVIYLKNVPSDYIQITSGLGYATPSNLLLTPIQTKDEIVGVLELASFYELDQNKIEFVKKVCESMASSIVSTKITERIQKLLSESQQQTEELRAQEEEVRQNMEELSASQEEISRRQLDNENVIRAIDSSFATVEFEPTGVILNANQNFADLMGYSLSEIKGQHHRMFVEPSQRMSKDYLGFWNILANGFEHKGKFKRINRKGEPVWINGNYTPLRNKTGEVVKIMKIAFDITSTTSREMQLINEIGELKNQLIANAKTFIGKEDEVKRVMEQLADSSSLAHKKMGYSQSSGNSEQIGNTSSNSAKE